MISEQDHLFELTSSFMVERENEKHVEKKNLESFTGIFRDDK